jgi:RNase P/RNase MRP subunit p29
VEEGLLGVEERVPQKWRETEEGEKGRVCQEDDTMVVKGQGRRWTKWLMA